MSTIIEKTVGNMEVVLEKYDSANEVAADCAAREMTSTCFNNMRKTTGTNGNWHGVGSYDEALELLRTGYQPTVEKLKKSLKISRTGYSKRIAFENNLTGFAPVVPLAMMSVPNCMIDMHMKPIKAKVLDVYYDMTAAWHVKSEKIIAAGQKLLSAIVALEQQGYRFNLYAIQSYTDSNHAYMLSTKVKSSSQPIDLKRISFPLTHVAYFRVIGFDWYSKCPKAKYLCGYGTSLLHTLGNGKKRSEFVKKVFGENATYFSCADMVETGADEQHITEVLTNGKN